MRIAFYRVLAAFLLGVILGGSGVFVGMTEGVGFLSNDKEVHEPLRDELE